MSVRILLADDHTAVRTGLRMILAADPALTVVGEAADGATAIAQTRALRPDVVIMDLRMPGTDGVTATRTIADEHLADVLALTTFDLDDLVLEALRAGAAGFLLKTADAPTLLAAVHRVAAGEGVIAPEVTRTLLAELTTSELDVLRCLGQGRSNTDLATHLAISPLTAKTHVSRLLTKLGLTSRLQAALLARDAGLVPPQ